MNSQLEGKEDVMMIVQHNVIGRLRFRGNISVAVMCYQSSCGVRVDGMIHEMLDVA